MGYALAIILRIWTVVAPPVFLWLFFDSTRRGLFEKRNPAAFALVYFPSALGSFLAICLFTGAGAGSIVGRDLGTLMGLILAVGWAVAFENLSRLRERDRRSRNFILQQTRRIQVLENEFRELSETSKQKALSGIYQDFRKHVESEDDDD